MKYKEVLDDYRDELVGMLCELVSIKSVQDEPAVGQPFGEKINQAFRYMLARAEFDGFEIFDAGGYGGHIEWIGAKVDERGEIYAAADETIGVAVHLDVVPAGGDWTYDPWGGEVVDFGDGGRVYGRGTMDNKGAVCAVYYAMKALKESGYIPAKNVRLILGLDEESGCWGMDKYFEQVQLPDLGFTPDAEFPVINGEKGILVFEIAKKLEIGPAESGLLLRSMVGGEAANMVPDHCRAILVYDDGTGDKKSKKKKKNDANKRNIAESQFALIKEVVAARKNDSGAKVSCKGIGSSIEISATGISAHGAQPEKGVNAISVLMDFLNTLPLGNESVRDFVDFYCKYIGSETDGESLGISMEDGLSGALILNIGKIDLNREAVVLTVNVRYPISYKESDIYGRLRPVLDENGLGVVKIFNMEPLYYPPDDPLVKTLMEVYRENTDDAESEPIIIGGGTYARTCPRTVAYGPRFLCDEDTAHQKDEFVRIDSLMNAAQIYADAIYRLSQI